MRTQRPFPPLLLLPCMSKTPFCPPTFSSGSSRKPTSRNFARSASRGINRKSQKGDSRLLSCLSYRTGPLAADEGRPGVPGCLQLDQNGKPLLSHKRDLSRIIARHLQVSSPKQVNNEEGLGSSSQADSSQKDSAVNDSSTSGRKRENDMSTKGVRGRAKIFTRPGRRDRELLKAGYQGPSGIDGPGNPSKPSSLLIRKFFFKGNASDDQLLPVNQVWAHLRNKSLDRLPAGGHRYDNRNVDITKAPPKYSTLEERHDRMEPRKNITNKAYSFKLVTAKPNAQHVAKVVMSKELVPSVKLKTMEVSRKLSLLEELFPAEAKKHQKSVQRSEEQEAEMQDLPRLDPPLLEISGDDISTPTPTEVAGHTTKPIEDEIPEGEVTIMVVMGVSDSLTQADFDRVIPHGEHIEEWRGLGEFLKVIPARDTTTLRQLNYYFLLFSNPTYAHAYKTHLTRLHTLSQTHTPLSLESPPLPPPGVIVNGANVHQLLQDYTLCPPSQDLHTRILFPPLKGGIRRILAANGYPQLTRPADKAGRAVIFWVEGSHDPSVQGIKALLATDGQDRGLQWGPMSGKGSIEPLLSRPAAAAEAGGQEDEGDGFSDGLQHVSPPSVGRTGPKRWILAFEDESEARRFARTWHLRPYPGLEIGERAQRGEPAPVIHATYAW